MGSAIHLDIVDMHRTISDNMRRRKFAVFFLTHTVDYMKERRQRIIPGMIFVVVYILSAMMDITIIWLTCVLRKGYRGCRYNLKSYVIVTIV